MSRDKRGSIEKCTGPRGVVYRVRVSLGVNERGRQIRHRASVHGTRADAEQKLTEMLRQIDQGVYVDPRSVTVAQYLQDWLDHCESRGLSPSTLRGYTGIVDRYIVPAMGSVRLQKLTPLQIERMYTDSLTSGRTKGAGEGLSGRTVLHTHRVLHAALKRATRLRLIAVNPADAVEPPRAARPEMNALDENESARMLKVLRESGDELLYAAVAVALYSGMRRGELLALRWSDVDFDAATVRIMRSLQNTKKDGLIFREPKTARSRRTVSLPAPAIRELRAHKARQAQVRLLVGSGYQDLDLVFARGDGSPLKPDTLTWAFREFRAANELTIRFHDLRHTHATLMLKSGESVKLVAERLGHSTAMLTLDTYAHVLQGMDAAAADRFGEMLERAEQIAEAR